MERIRSMRLPRRCSVILAVLVLGASQAAAQTSVATYDKATIGGDSLPADVFRLLGLGNVGSGSGTINPLTLDNLGDVRKDTNTTVSTAGAWNHTALFTLGAGLNLTGNLTPGSGTLPVVGALSTTGDIAINGNDLTS